MEARRIGRSTTTAELRAYPSADSSSYTGPSGAAAKMRARLVKVCAKQRAAEAAAKKLQLPVLGMRRLRGKQSMIKSEEGSFDDHLRGQVECSVCYSTTC